MNTKPKAFPLLLQLPGYELLHALELVAPDEFKVGRTLFDCADAIRSLREGFWPAFNTMDSDWWTSDMNTRRRSLRWSHAMHRLDLRRSQVARRDE